MGTIADKLGKLAQTKADIKAAIAAKGQAVGDADTFASYAGKIAAIQTGVDTSDATAVAGDIAQGKTAYAGGQLITGTLTPMSFVVRTPNVSTKSGTISASLDENGLFGTITVTVNPSYDGNSYEDGLIIFPDDKTTPTYGVVAGTRINISTILILPSSTYNNGYSCTFLGNRNDFSYAIDDWRFSVSRVGNIWTIAVPDQGSFNAIKLPLNLNAFKCASFNVFKKD